MISFEVFYEAIHGRKPFFWQIELAELLVAGGWYDLLDLPPSSGKTAIIEVWFYALYREALSGVKRQVPLRLWYVVDRKGIVDDAYEAANKIKEALKTGALQEVTSIILNKFAPIDLPLIVGRMRGGLARNVKNQWLSTPNQPLVVTSTVDQYGSRLLFRGYDLSPKMAPIHAGLAALDSLVVLDESQLSQGLRATLSKILEFQPDLGLPKTKVVELRASYLLHILENGDEVEGRWPSCITG